MDSLDNPIASTSNVQVCQSLPAVEGDPQYVVSRGRIVMEWKDGIRHVILTSFPRLPHLLPRTSLHL
jgi:hypothetical protein